MNKLTFTGLSPQQLAHLQQLVGTFVDLVPTDAIERHCVRFYNLPVGSHVALLRDGTYHHGIYVGEDRGVIHFTGESKEKDTRRARIQLDSLESFVEEDISFYHIQYVDDTEERRAHTVAVAEFLHAHLHDTEGLYHAVVANCECFAAYCRTGKSKFVPPIEYQYNVDLHVFKPHFKDTLMLSVLSDVIYPRAR